MAFRTLIFGISYALILSYAQTEGLEETCQDIIQLCTCGRKATFPVYVEGCSSTSRNGSSVCVPCANGCDRFAHCETCDANRCLTCTLGKRGLFCNESDLTSFETELTTNESERSTVPGEIRNIESKSEIGFNEKKIGFETSVENSGLPIFERNRGTISPNTLLTLDNDRLNMGPETWIRQFLSKIKALATMNKGGRSEGYPIAYEVVQDFVSSENEKKKHFDDWSVYDMDTVRRPLKPYKANELKTYVTNKSKPYIIFRRKGILKFDRRLPIKDFRQDHNWIIENSYRGNVANAKMHNIQQDRSRDYYGVGKSSYVFLKPFSVGTSQSNAFSGKHLAELPFQQHQEADSNINRNNIQSLQNLVLHGDQNVFPIEAKPDISIRHSLEKSNKMQNYYLPHISKQVNPVIAEENYHHSFWKLLLKSLFTDKYNRQKFGESSNYASLRNQDFKEPQEINRNFGESNEYDFNSSENQRPETSQTLISKTRHSKQNGTSSVGENQNDPLSKLVAFPHGAIKDSGDVGEIIHTKSGSSLKTSDTEPSFTKMAETENSNIDKNIKWRTFSKLLPQLKDVIQNDSSNASIKMKKLHETQNKGEEKLFIRKKLFDFIIAEGLESKSTNETFSGEMVLFSENNRTEIAVEPNSRVGYEQAKNLNADVLEQNMEVSQIETLQSSTTDKDHTQDTSKTGTGERAYYSVELSRDFHLNDSSEREETYENGLERQLNNTRPSNEDQSNLSRSSYHKQKQRINNQSEAIEETSLKQVNEGIMSEDQRGNSESVRAKRYINEEWSEDAWCQVPPAVLRGSSITCKDDALSKMCTLSCDEGYVANNTEFQCSGDKWTPPFHPCQQTGEEGNDNYEVLQDD